VRVVEDARSVLLNSSAAQSSAALVIKWVKWSMWRER
jgi:hypothetical protein